MSLINDALRKAQKQRTGETVPLATLPSVGGESAARIHKRGKPAGFYTLLLRLGLGAGGLAVLVIGGCILLRAGKKPAPVAALPETAAVPLPVPATPVATPKPPVTAAAAPASTPATTFTLPLAGHAAPATAAAAATPSSQSPAPVVAKPPAAAPPVEPVAVVPAAAPAAKMEGRAINYIENLRIAGIRASATDAKVLMNDRVYRLGDIVEHELGLKLVGITASSLTFEDEHGARYTRSF